MSNESESDIQLCEHCGVNHADPLYQLGLEIDDQGGWEEFHQRGKNFTMQSYH